MPCQVRSALTWVFIAVQVDGQAHLGRSCDVLYGAFVFASLAQGQLGAKHIIKHSIPLEAKYILMLALLVLSNIKAEFSNPSVVNFSCIAEGFPMDTKGHEQQSGHHPMRKSENYFQILLQCP